MNDIKQIRLSDSTHYLKSALASIKTTSETLKLLTESEKDKRRLLLLQEEKIMELNFRIELFTNYLLREQKPAKLGLEFFDFSELISKTFEKKTKEKIEMLADRELLDGLLNYLLRLSKDTSTKFENVGLTQKGSKVFLVLNTQGKKEIPKKSDLALEIDLLTEVLVAWSKVLKGKLKIKNGEYILELPLKFTL